MRQVIALSLPSLAAAALASDMPPPSPPRSVPSPASAPVTLAELRGEILDRLALVREFREMRKAALELGIPRAYLFGGPAATFAHYVYGRTSRGRGGGRRTPLGRFDYRHDSIFRVNQDIDVALDTDDPKPGRPLRGEDGQKFGHFQGDKPAWEAQDPAGCGSKTRGHSWGTRTSSTRTATPTQQDCSRSPAGIPSGSGT